MEKPQSHQEISNLIRKNLRVSGDSYRRLSEAERKGEEVKSHSGKVKGWKYQGKFHSNPDFVREVLGNNNN